MNKVMQIESALHSSELKNQRVLLRADLNVLDKNGKIINSHRLTEILPTINLIQKKGGKVILATHIGRPKKQEKKLSTANLVPWFEKNGYAIEFEPTLKKAHQKSVERFEEILLLENMRFFAGEKTNDQQFAKQLAQLGDYFVQDAFGLVHRTDTSTTDVPKLFTPDKRTVGLLIEKELKKLNLLLENPQSPFVLIIGGAKISGKLPILHAFVKIVDTIILCPAIVFTFLKALGKPVGKSLVDDSLIPASKEILDAAREHGTKIVFPIDYQIAHETFKGPITYIDSTEIADNQFGISIGRKTEKLFAQEISQAKTVFFNGAIGDPTRKETLQGMHSILSAMTQSEATTIIAGGDSVAVAQGFEMKDKFSFCSTGGGATLAYLSGKNLPGLAQFTQ